MLLWSALHGNRRPAPSFDLLLHVGSVLDVLPEIADVAADFLVGLHAEGDHGDEAECEPLPGEDGLAGERRLGGKGSRGRARGNGGRGWREWGVGEGQ